MTSDRRSTARCPVCQGPTFADAASPEGIRCRNSMCAHNHAGVTCPRCGDADVEPAGFRDGNYSYRCKACQRAFTRAEG